MIMLYLVKSYFPLGKFIYKIGFSEDSNIKIRLDNYFYTSPGSEVISLRKGDEMLEDLIHYYLYCLGYRYQKNGRLDEWFVGDPEVLSIFHISRESLERKIWKHRDKVFNKDKVKSKTSLDYKLFKYLFLKNKDNFIGISIILNKDGDPIKTKAKSVDIEFWKFEVKELQKEVKNFPINPEFLMFKSEFDSSNFFSNRLRVYCTHLDYYKDNFKISSYIRSYVKDPRYQKYYSHYGTSGCRALNFQKGDLEQGMKSRIDVNSNMDLIYGSFKIGEKYSTKIIKSMLKDIYSSLGILKTPKASDLGDYFILEDTRVLNSETGKRDRGFKIISKRV